MAVPNRAVLGSNPSGGALKRYGVVREVFSSLS